MKRLIANFLESFDPHVIIIKIVKYFISACGITLLLCFFGQNAEGLTKENLKSIIITILMIECILGMFSWFIRKSNTLELPQSWQEISKEAMLAGVKQEEVDECKRIITIHEAGHAVMAYIKNLNKYDIDLTSNCVYTSQSLTDVEEYKDSIMVRYAGAAAEEIVFGQFRSGCFGSKTADFETSTELIKGYLVMTDKSISKAMLAEEMIPKIIDLSNQLYAKTIEDLKPYQDTILSLAKELETRNKIPTDEVKMIIMKGILKRDARKIKGDNNEN